MNRSRELRLPSTARLCFTLVFALTLSSPGLAADLDTHLWRERLLLVFAPAADHPEHVRLAGELERRAPELDERQLVVYRLFLQDASRSDRRPLEAAAAEALRRRFGVTAGETVLILIGKDGGEKLRAATGTLDLDTVFQRIDAMPMRRLEMRRRQ
jgi:hypothetical protein